MGKIKPDAVWPKDGPSRNPVAKRAYFARYEREHRLRINEVQRRWRAENHERRLATQKRYRDSHKQKICDISRNRRGAKQGSSAVAVDFEAIARRDGMICHLCRKRVETLRELHFDHVIPLAKGGSHTPENIAVSHAKCNQQKQAKVLTLF